MIKVSRACVGEEEMVEIQDAMNYGYYGLAYKVNQLEDEIKKYLKTDRDVVCVANGTAALHLALDAAGVGPGDEVIIPSFTFIATAQAVSMVGAKSVLCDIDETTFLMDIDDLKRKITKKTKAIIPVHYSGNVCDMNALLELKKQYGIRIIEDAAHAFGSTYGSKKIGDFGDITCFSFDSIKVMTCTEGGAIVTNDADLADLCRQKRLLGIERKTMHVQDWKQRSWIYNVKTTGYRYHMSNVCAAVGLAQIKKVDSFIKRRREICEIYANAFNKVKGIKLEVSDYSTISPFMFPILVLNEKRDDMRDYLKERDIETGISYIPLHRFDLFKSAVENFPKTEKVFSEVLCLPIHPNLTDLDIALVISTILEFLSR